MAIVQISRITQRKGLAIDLPQLAGAELGWSIDERRLWIGNGTLAEGAPVVGNTEVLTEFSDILSLSTAYTYKGQAAGYTVQTGPTIGSPVTQSLQSWMDQWASIKDFGATGDGVTDDTAAINRALYQIYCREINPQIRRSIFFPAGVYRITDSITIPPYATLIGEGANNSIIRFDIDDWSSAVTYESGVLVNNSGTYYRSQSEVPSGIAITNTTYWVSEALPGYVARTADSQQNVGNNISATPPQYITVKDMAFENVFQYINPTTEVLTTLDIFLVEDASYCTFEGVGFRGSMDQYDLTPRSAAGPNPAYAPPDNSCVAFSSTPSLICNQVVFDTCEFTGVTYGINTAEDLTGVTITDSKFNFLYKGAVLGSGTLSGVTGFRITSNVFDNIYAEGIVFRVVNLNISGYNIFYDVGNHFGGITQPYTAIIDIQYNNNASIGDMFARTDAFSDAIVPGSSYPRIVLNDTTSIGITNSKEISLGTYTRESGQYATLNDGQASAITIVSDSGTSLEFDTETIRAFTMNYTIIRDVVARTGTLLVVANADDSSGDLEYSDDYTENLSAGVTLSVTQSGQTLSIKYTSTSTGIDPIITYSINRLA